MIKKQLNYCRLSYCPSAELCILSKTRTLKLPSWWLNPARSPASQIRLHLFPSTLFPFQVYIPNGSETGRDAKLTLQTAAKAMLYVLLIPSSPAGQPQSPHWEGGRGEKTPHSLVMAREALNCAAFFGRSLFLHCSPM